MANCDCCGKSIIDAQFLLINNVVYKSCPDCSKQAGQLVFYPCPDSFGTTAKRSTQQNPMGLQSHCSPCRSQKKGPHKNAIMYSDAKTDVGFIINEIRFLPMGQSVFATYEDAKNFILNTMPNRGGTYYFMKSKIDCPTNTFMLFQYGGQLIGYAIYSNTIEFETPFTLDDGKEYGGYYQFAPNSITLLNKPITKEDFLSIDSTFKSFSQSPQKKPVGLLPAIFKLINNKKGIICATTPEVSFEEINIDEAKGLKEGAKKQIIVNAYERNSSARNACINHYRKKNNGRLKCEICGFDFGKVYGDKFVEKIHIHHLVEISTIGEEYEIDAIKDLIPICPNCHMVAHSRKPAYTPDEIKQMIKFKG